MNVKGIVNTITIPAKSELTSTMDILAFNDQYQNISSYGIWAHIPMTN